MKGFGLGLGLGLVVLACMMVAPHAEAGITCSDIMGSFTSCLSYLQDGGAVPPKCCAGVRLFNSATKTTTDRRVACDCLRQIATSMPGLNPTMASSLPGKCHVHLGYPISLSVDCSKVK